MLVGVLGVEQSVVLGTDYEAVPEPLEKWTEVWGPIYIGEIYDLLGQRARAVNEYSLAKRTNDNTGGAQEVIDRLLKKPYSEPGTTPFRGCRPCRARPSSPPRRNTW